MVEYWSVCPYCGSDHILHIWPESSFDQCRSCLLYFRNPMPWQEELDELYNRSWSNPEIQRSETGGTDDCLAYVYARKLARSLGRRDLQDLKIMDFGAGRGAMLKALERLGARAVGVEPYGFEYLQSQGFEAYGGWIYVATGNPVGLNAKKGRWREARKQGHLLFPHPRTMERILRGAGFQRIRRLRWLIRFKRNPVKVGVHYLMQLLGLDGELRYLAWR